ncbi:uncharacterized protein LOC130949739 [Arachis stenosperma]|uniref:uncharacterized protein LOC130949739 n=1 Tax=Arachis stenosperma TaxID=217475 RepID=UPI0025ACCCDA|nr:uncharacterized protein LOC130949739 [Arachis stenosperma]
MCVIRSDWERYLDKRLWFIRRGDLIPEAKGWFELVRRSILPASNNSEVNIARATIVHILIKGGGINVHEIIAEGIQDSAEKTDLSARPWYPSTILRLCMKAKVAFEDNNPNWVNPGRLVTLQHITYVAPAQQQRRPQIRKRTLQEEPHQEEPHQEEPHQEEYQQEEYYDPTNINLNHIQGAMEGQEQQLHVQSQRMNRQEKLLPNWMNQQSEWQKQQTEQQQEHYSQLTQAINQVTERQERQDKCLQELNQCQLSQMKAFNEFNVLNEGRQLHWEEFIINTQAKLTYVAGHMHNLHSSIPRYDTVCKDLTEQEEGKVKQQKEALKKKMEDASFWKKLIGKRKGNGDSSNQEGSHDKGNKGT